MTYLPFLDASTEKGLALSGIYELPLVFLSIFMAFIGSYTVTCIVERIRDTPDTKKKGGWFLLGALSFASGIFSMHFIGMLAYKLPIETHYDLSITLLSILPALVASLMLVYIKSRTEFSIMYRAGAGIFIGLNIAGMHFIGMHAMHFDGQMFYDPGLLAVSIIVVMLLALLAVTTRLLREITGRVLSKNAFDKLLSPFLMALSISGMHYIAMEATLFFPLDSDLATDATTIDNESMSLLVASLTAMLCLTTLMLLNNESIQLKARKLSGDFRSMFVSLFLRLFATGIILIISIAMIAFYLHNKTANSELSAKCIAQLELARAHAIHDFDIVFSNMILLMKDTRLHDFLEGETKRSRKELQEQFLTISRETKLFDQIRLIDMEGKELVRVARQKGKYQAIRASSLQDKANRDFFMSASSLSKGEFFVSRFDLNQENGKIEMPPKPIIRFASPVFYENGEKRGILVLNYLGLTVLDSIQKVFSSPDIEAFLLNEKGYYLLSNRKEEEWGFMYDREITFGKKHPVTWNLIQKKNDGDITTRAELLHFTTIKVVSEHSLWSSTITSDREWKLVIKTPGKKLKYEDLIEHPFIFSIIFTLLMLTGFISWRHSLLQVSRKIAEEENATLLKELNYQKFAMDEHSIISAADARGNITYMNDKFCEISGYTREELMGKNHRKLKSGEHSKEFYQEMWKCLRNGKVWSGEVKNRKKGEGYYWVQASIVPFLDKSGKPYQYISIRTDITQQKENQKALTRAKEGAEMADKAKSQFLSSMSHELRTPLNSILGFGQLLESDPSEPLTQNQKEGINHIMKSGQHLLHLINEILDLSKIEAGKLSVSIEAVQLDSVVKDAVKTVSSMEEKYHVQVINKVSQESGIYVVSDLVRLKQVILNLLSNGIKYNKAGGSVTIEAEAGEEDHKLIIRDTGRGIDEKHLKSLFEPFNRLGAEALDIEGTGIGMTITKRLVEIMQGEIAVSSVLGEGSVFTVTLKAGKKQSSSLSEGDEAALPQQEENKETTVLYVEDNAANIKLVKNILKRRSNIKLLIATTGEEGIKMAEKELPSLILMDINLPEINGFEAMKQIRMKKGMENVPVIAVSANAMLDTVEKGKSEGFYDYITKPFNIGKFLQSVDDCIHFIDEQRKANDD